MATVDCFVVKAVNNVRSKPRDIFDESTSNNLMMHPVVLRTLKMMK